MVMWKYDFIEGSLATDPERNLEWHPYEMFRRPSNSCRWLLLDLQIISVSDLFEFDLNLPELNLPSALSFLDISTCVWSVSVYRWLTTWLLTDIKFSFDDKIAEK